MIAGFVDRIVEAVGMAAGMFWQVGWSLALGFIISGLLQNVVSRDTMVRAIGRDGVREIAIATLAGAASSSCSYAAASVSRTLFKRGGALVPALAFLFASTNLVAELGIVLLLLLGWQFMAAEWIGGIVLIVILSLLVRITYPARLVEAARQHAEPGRGGHGSGGGASLTAVARSVAMDWSMLWKDLLLGFLIAGFLSVFVPGGVWQALFVHGASAWVQVPANALLGPLVAVLSFVCSIGNVPMAAVLWSSGVSFGGVLAFLYADLLVLPLLDVYRRQYGLKMAAYLAAVFYASMVAAALLMDVVFRSAGWIPRVRPPLRAHVMHFSIDATFWLNLVFAAATIALFVLARRAPVQASHCEHHHA